MKNLLLILVAALILTGCKNKSDDADAYGNFEATEVIVSAETSGRILKFEVTEGMEIEKGSEIALIDTTLFHLQKAEIDAGMKSSKDTYQLNKCTERHPETADNESEC